MDVDLALMATPEDTVTEMGSVIIVMDAPVRIQFIQAIRLNEVFEATAVRSLPCPVLVANAVVPESHL
jgi:hypothetical protein